MANANWSQIVTTTLAGRSKKLEDNVSNNNALLARLKKRGKVKPFSGGRTIVHELQYAENSTYMRYSGYETLNISPSDVLTAAEYNIKQAAIAVSISGLETLQNSGSEQMIDLLEAKIENAELTFMNNMSTDIYSDGTASGGKQIGGTQSLVADAGTGTVGGIDSSTYTFWQNQFYDFSVETVTPSSSTIQTAMNTLYLNLVRGRDAPDLIVADNTYFRYYWESLQANQRFTSDELGQAGFQNLKFMGADVVADGGQDGSCPSSHMYFLNTNYLKLRPHKDRDYTPLDPDRFATNQDAMVKLVGWAGNMTCGNRSLQGVIVA